MVIRDLTLRSAASFGSFHLIRLLYDEYMFYIIEHKVAAAMQETSIAVMADYRQVDYIYCLYFHHHHPDDYYFYVLLLNSQRRQNE